MGGANGCWMRHLSFVFALRGQPWRTRAQAAARSWTKTKRRFYLHEKGSKQTEAKDELPILTRENTKYHFDVETGCV